VIALVFQVLKHLALLLRTVKGKLRLRQRQLDDGMYSSSALSARSLVLSALRSYASVSTTVLSPTAAALHAQMGWCKELVYVGSRMFIVILSSPSSLYPAQSLHLLLRFLPAVGVELNG
jgi:hypothetical protein